MAQGHMARSDQAGTATPLALSPDPMRCTTMQHTFFPHLRLQGSWHEAHFTDEQTKAREG